jgi:hypothetical protein
VGLRRWIRSTAPRLSRVNTATAGACRGGSIGSARPGSQQPRPADPYLGTDSVDLVVLNRAPTALLGRIVRDRRVILDREPFLRHRFESLALRQ